MSREEIKDLIEMNYENNLEGLVDHIYNLESELLRTQRGLESAQLLISESISIDRYKDILKKYNDLQKKRK